MRATIVHETFHATQHAVRRAAPGAGAALSALRAAPEAIFGEGTASCVAPARAMSAEEHAQAVRVERALLERDPPSLGVGAPAC